MLNRQRPQPGQKDLRGWEWRYLWQQTRSDALFTLGQESSEIFSLAVSPDGSLLAAGMDPQFMTRRVRVRCARCRTINIAAELPVQAARRPRPGAGR